MGLVEFQGVSSVLELHIAGFSDFEKLASGGYCPKLTFKEFAVGYSKVFVED